MKLRAKGLANCFGYKKVVISRFFFIHFSIAWVKKIVHYTKDLVIQRFVISRFHCRTVQ